jgi:dihydropteroate synthase
MKLPSGTLLDAGQRPLVMGVLNVTPDSFSDGGRFFRPDLAAERAREMEEAGADVIDVGGESTRPGSEPVSAKEEKRRVIPVVEELAAESSVPVSIDTQKAEVAREALRKGAQMINDVSGLRSDPDMAALAAESGVPVCLMHMQGAPGTMQKNPIYDDVVGDILAWLARRIESAEEAGIERSRIFADPGFGFGKTVQHNLEIMRRLHEFQQLGCPVMIGTSRKSTLGAVLNAEADERLYGTLATVASAVMSGCHMVRVHDPGPALDVVRVCEAIRNGMEWQG